MYEFGNQQMENVFRIISYINILIVLTSVWSVKGLIRYVKQVVSLVSWIKDFRLLCICTVK